MIQQKFVKDKTATRFAMETKTNHFSEHSYDETKNVEGESRLKSKRMNFLSDFMTDIRAIPFFVYSPNHSPHTVFSLNVWNDYLAMLKHKNWIPMLALFLNKLMIKIIHATCTYLFIIAYISLLATYTYTLLEGKLWFDMEFRLCLNLDFSMYCILYSVYYCIWLWA